MPDINGELTRDEAASLGMSIGDILGSVAAQERGLPYRKIRWVVCDLCVPALERAVHHKDVQTSRVLCQVHRKNANNPRHLFNRGPASLTS